MKLVFDIFIDNLFTSHHSFTFSSSEFIRASRVFRLLAEANTLVSSAKIEHKLKIYGIDYQFIVNDTVPYVSLL